jgi:cell shape-determining protein MreC
MTRQSSKLRQSDVQQPGWQQQQQQDNDRMARLETEIAQLRSENAEIAQLRSEIARLHADNDHLRSVLELPPPSEGVPPV